MRLVGWRGYYAMDAALQIPIWPELQGVGNVDSDASRVGFNVFPGAVRAKDLEGWHRLAEEESQAAKVRVATGVDVLGIGIFLWGSGTVHLVAEVAVAIAIVLVGVDKMILRNLENDGNQCE